MTIAESSRAATGPARPPVVLRRRSSTPLVASAATGAVVAAAYAVFAWWQWSTFVVKSWDLTIFTELLQRYAALQPPIVDVKGAGYDLLGDHFHPLLAVLAPVYALFPSALTLLVLQGACFGTAAAVFTRAAIRHLGLPVGVALGCAFGFSWGLQSAVEAQFHEIALAVPLLTAALCAVLDRRWRAAALWAAPLVFVKEDLGLTVAAIGVLIAVRARRPSGLWLAVWGVGWFLIATRLVLPALNPDGRWAYAANDDPLAVLHSAGLFSPSKGLTLLLLLTASGGLALCSPVALLLLPTLAWRFLSTNYGYWGPTWHYSAVLMPVLFVAVADALLRLRRSDRGWQRAWGRRGWVPVVVAGVLLLPTLPLHDLLLPGAWTPTARTAAAREVLGLVPAGVSVEADRGLMSYVVDHHDVFHTTNRNPPPGCVLVDTLLGGSRVGDDRLAHWAERHHPGVAYTERFDRDGYQLACRAHPAPR